MAGRRGMLNLWNARFARRWPHWEESDEDCRAHPHGRDAAAALARTGFHPRARQGSAAAHLGAAPGARDRSRRRGRRGAEVRQHDLRGDGGRLHLPAGGGLRREQVRDSGRRAPSTPRGLAAGSDPGVARGVGVGLSGGAGELPCSQRAVRSSPGPESARVQLSREREPLDRDFVLRWKLAAEKVKPALLVHGEYAMLSLVAPAREGYLGTPRDVVFVVDRSGSMQGSKMVSAARACSLLLRTLGPRDRFAVQAFDETVEWMPGGFTPADEAGIERGEKWLRGIFARGGTELDAAMREALAEIRKLGLSEGRVPVVVLLTDGQVGDESSALKRLQGELGDARVFTVGIDSAVNDGFLKRLAALGA